MLTLVIGNKNYSSWSLRPWLLLRQAGASFTEIVVPLSQPDTRASILKHSPAGKVPVLIDGGVTVWESLAICEYVAELFPSAGLWPEDRGARAHARAISNEMHAGFAALRRAMPFDARRTHKPSERTKDVDADIDRVQAIWREARAKHGGSGPFLFGRFTIADAMYAPVAGRFQTYDVAMDDVSSAYARAILELPAMQEWYAAAKVEPWAL
jgi:glutathione S-transferase